MDMVQDQLCIPLNKLIKTIDLLESMTKLPVMSGVSRVFFPYSEASIGKLRMECVKYHVSLVMAEHSE